MTEDQKTSLGSQKLKFLEQLSADPQVKSAGVEVALSYLRFTTSFTIGKSYRAIVDIQADTGLTRNTIKDHRNKLVDLGYFTAAGFTKDGVPYFEIRFVRENVIQDHKVISRETLREQQNDRKRDHRKRQNVLSNSDRTKKPCPVKFRQDVLSIFDPNYLEEYLDVSVIELDGKVRPYVERLISDRRYDDARSLLDTLAPAVGSDNRTQTQTAGRLSEPVPSAENSGDFEALGKVSGNVIGIAKKRRAA